MRTKHLLGMVAALVAAIMLIGGGTAGAVGTCPTDIRGEGSSLQRLAQEAWGGAFRTQCAERRSVSYAATGSGAGLAAWHADGHAGSVSESGDHFIGTDDAPTSVEVENIRAHANSAGVAVIPVAQAAVAVIHGSVANCTIASIDNRALEEVWAHRVTNWERVTPRPTGTGCNKTITRVVRQDKSGTTFQFKHYLWLVNETRRIRLAAEAERTWLELQSATDNVNWPDRETVSIPASSGGGALVTRVRETEGSIGYANLGDALGVANVTIVKVQNGREAGGEPTYAEPKEAGAGANCANASYRENLGRGNVVGEERTPITLALIWTDVYGSNPNIRGTTYSICTLTWDVAVLNYATAGYTSTIGTMVKHYLEYLLEPTGGAERGQERAKERNYGALPSAIRSAAASIASGIS
jgi:ABC-type phosphate transport system substrate-binding protein